MLTLALDLCLVSLPFLSTRTDPRETLQSVDIQSRRSRESARASRSRLGFQILRDWNVFITTRVSPHSLVRLGLAFCIANCGMGRGTRKLSFWNPFWTVRWFETLSYMLEVCYFYYPFPCVWFLSSVETFPICLWSSWSEPTRSFFLSLYLCNSFLVLLLDLVHLLFRFLGVSTSRLQDGAIQLG